MHLVYPSVPYGLLIKLENLSTPHIEFAAFEESMALNLAYRSFKVIHYGTN